MVMLESATIEMIDQWRRKAKLEAHKRLEELRRPDELNDLIMTKVNLIVGNLSGCGDATELARDIATLLELIQIRRSQSELPSRQARI